MAVRWIKADNLVELVESLSRIRFANCGAWQQIEFLVRVSVGAWAVPVK